MKNTRKQPTARVGRQTNLDSTASACGPAVSRPSSEYPKSIPALLPNLCSTAAAGRS